MAPVGGRAPGARARPHATSRPAAHVKIAPDAQGGQTLVAAVRRRRVSAYGAGQSLDPAIDACRRPARYGMTSTVGYSAPAAERPRGVADVHLAASRALEAAEMRRGDGVVARLPYVARRRVGLRTIVQPQFTHTLGPWLAATSGKPGKAKDKERALLGELIDMLPPFDVFRQCFSPALAAQRALDAVGKIARRG